MRTLTLAASILGVSALLVFLSYTFLAQGSGYIGLPVTQSVATTTSVGPDTVVELFASNPQCTARTIVTNYTAVNFLTGDPGNGDLASTSLTLNNGLYQAASTTVTYEAGMNGCGRWFGRSSATNTVTLIEYQ